MWVLMLLLLSFFQKSSFALCLAVTMMDVPRRIDCTLRGCRSTSTSAGWRLVAAVAAAVSVVGASRDHTTAYRPYQYDFTAPLFTPDGRLLQTEYACAAADHSTPIVVVPVPVRGNDRDNCGVICLLTVRRSADFCQHRLVILPDSNVCIALSGILADSLVLLQTVEKETLQTLRNYGGHRPTLSAARVAACMAEKCQSHTFGFGMRPVGATLLVAGTWRLDPTWVPTTKNHKKDLPVLHLTDPSGAVRDIPCREAVVVGGGKKGEALQRHLQKQWRRLLKSHASDNNESSYLGKIFRLVLDAYLESVGSEAESEGVALEAVLLSPAKNAFRLDQHTIKQLLGRARPKKK